jgi:hypothetical protein
MSEEITLLECPHCDSGCVLEQPDPEIFRWAVYCTNNYCACCTPLCTSPKKAVEVWNRRVKSEVKE